MRFIFNTLPLILVFCYSIIYAQEEKMCPHPDTVAALKAYEKGKLALGSNKPDSAVFYMNKAKEIFSDIKCWEQTVKMSYNLTVIYSKLNEAKKAEAEIKSAKAIADKNLPDNSRWKGKIELYFAEKEFQKKAFDAAEKHVKVAYSIFMKAEAWKEAIASKRLLAQVYLYKLDYKLMEESINDAYSITKEKLKSDPNIIKSILQLYGVLYYKTGDYESALEKSLEGLNIVQKNMKGREDTSFVASLYNNIGLFYIEVGDIEKAEDYSKNALTLSIQLDEKIKAATIYQNLAHFYYEKLQYDKSYINYKKSLEILNTIKNGDLDKDVELLSIQMNLGIARSGYEIGKKEEAFKALELNLERHKKNSYSADVSNLVLGNLYLREKQFEKSKKYLLNAIPAAKQIYPSGKHPNIGDIYLSLAELSAAENDIVSALSYSKMSVEALNMKSDKSGTDDLSQISDKNILLKNLEYQADWHQKEGRLQEAYNIIFNAAKLTDELRNAFKSEGSKLFFLQKVIPIYEKALEVAIAINLKSPDIKLMESAYNLVEKSKSMLLLDAFRAEEARAFGDVPDILLKEEKRLTRELAKKQKSLFEAQASRNESEIQKLQQEILGLRQSWQELEKTLENKYNSYYKLKYSDKTATIKEIQDYLPKDAVLLEYFVGNINIYLFSISKTEIKVKVFPKDADFEKHVKNLRLTLTDNSALKDKGKSAENYKKLTEHGFAIFDNYVKKGIPDNTKELIIIADGLLNYIPFDVLLSEKVSNTEPNFKTLPYLLHKYNIHYHYSASLMLYDIKKSKSNGRLLALAPSYQYQTQGSHSDERQHLIRSSVGELPGAKQEVASLGQIYRGKFLYDKDANEKNFKQLAEKENYAVIHLAMHGWVDENQPPMSNLVLSNIAGTEDNLLHAYELNLLKMNADLVVLSACETGFGKYERGEGVVSIGRGFMYAGVPSLVMTLWPINDRATAMLVTEFYKQLSKGKTKSEALRAAKINYLEQADASSAHPFFWAAFINVGDDKAIRIKKKSDWIIWTLGIAGSIALMTLVGYWAGRIRKSIVIKRSQDKRLHS